jgi:hypothetical protein
MKLVGVMGAFLIFCAPSFSQKVCIDKEVAVYFLQQDEKATILTELKYLDSLKIHNLTDQLLVKDKIITTYQNDSQYYQEIISTKNQELTYKDEQLKGAKRQIRRQKFQKFIAIGVLVVIAVLK